MLADSSVQVHVPAVAQLGRKVTVCSIHRGRANTVVNDKHLDCGVTYEWANHATGAVCERNKRNKGQKQKQSKEDGEIWSHVQAERRHKVWPCKSDSALKIASSTSSPLCLYNWYYCRQQCLSSSAPASGARRLRPRCLPADEHRRLHHHHPNLQS